MVNTSLNKANSRIKFLEKVAKMYNSPLGYPQLIEFSEKYRGVYKEELLIVMGYLKKSNNGSSSRVLGLNVSDLEEILNKTGDKNHG